MSVISRQQSHQAGGHQPSRGYGATSRPPLQLEQLELAFAECSRPALPAAPKSDEGGSGRLRPGEHRDRSSVRAGLARGYGAAGRVPWLQHASRDYALEAQARALLRATGAARIAGAVRVVWNRRLQTAAGRADYREKLISLNPRLHEHGAAEIERTLRHELAHFLAQFRAGRRRVSPHGPEWRTACHDLGIDDEMRCHNLPFPIRERVRRFLYRCSNCGRDFPRVRRIRRVIACLACCRAHNGGDFDARFRLRLVSSVISSG